MISFKSVIFHKPDVAGIILKADSLGSVEALLNLLKDAEIPVNSASVGNITRKEVMSATAVAAQEPLYGAIMGFNVKILDEAWEESRSSGIPIIYSDIIYRLIDEYREWVKSEKEKMKRKAIEKFVWPGKIKVLEGFVFRASKPAIFGVDVLGGKIRKNYRLMNENGEVVGEVREIQREKEKVEEANPGEQLAISCDGINMGKNVNEGDTLFTYMTADEIKVWDEKSDLLTGPEKELYNIIRGKLRKYF
jgi:translation initiation factor 5B